jgi:hypothetical protein
MKELDVKGLLFMPITTTTTVLNSVMTMDALLNASMSQNLSSN